MAEANYGVNMRERLVSILINNYNYERFLREAIDSALNQTYQNIEVVVVDDGSTDRSREIIASYGDRIIPILKENSGQASAFNAGVATSRGDLICFLDADDFYYPQKVYETVEAINKHPACPSIMIYHLLGMVDEYGRSLKETIPSASETFEPNLTQHARKYGFLPYSASPTSGFCLTRSLANQVFPIPEAEARVSADDFVVRACALLGGVYRNDQVLGIYRVHGKNRWFMHKPKKSREYMASIQNYLNEKLLASGKEPLICFEQSIYGREYAEGFGSLIKLAFVAVRRNFDLVTARFFLGTLKYAVREVFTRTSKRARQSRDEAAMPTSAESAQTTQVE